MTQVAVLSNLMQFQATRSVFDEDIPGRLIQKRGNYVSRRAMNRVYMQRGLPLLGAYRVV